MPNILLIDDNPGLLAMQAEFLRQAGHQVATAANGKEAMRLVTGADSFDVIVTDLVMPEKEGIETIIDLRRKFPALKIIAMSGGGRGDAAGYLHIARGLGAAQTLAKPFSGKELVEVVAGVLASPEGKA